MLLISSQLYVQTFIVEFSNIEKILVDEYIPAKLKELAAHTYITQSTELEHIIYELVSIIRKPLALNT